jgi:hypothetical protein
VFQCNERAERKRKETEFDIVKHWKHFKVEGETELRVEKLFVITNFNIPRTTLNFMFAVRLFAFGARHDWLV